MDVLATLAPIGLIVGACVGMHFLMMRGMHGGHGANANHEGHTGLANEDSLDRVTQLESQVARLQRELESSQGNGQITGNGHRREPVPAMRRHDKTAGDDPGRGYN
jgi:hypothetical protein